MEDFNKRSADIFSALDAVVPSQSKETSGSSPGDREFKRPREVYRPPPKRTRTDSSGKSVSSDVDKSRSDSIHGDHRKHSSPRHHHRQSHDLRRRDRRAPHHDSSKWTRYDLKDVGTEELSGLSDDQLNRHVAYTFLEDLKKRNHPKEEAQDIIDTKIIFKKPVRSQRDREESTDGRAVERLSAGAGVRAMPGCVVGRSGVKRRRLLPAVPSGEETGSGGDESGCGLNSAANAVSKAQGRVQQSAVALSHLEDCDD